jgi:hypothetical protein
MPLGSDDTVAARASAGAMYGRGGGATVPCAQSGGTDVVALVNTLTFGFSCAAAVSASSGDSRIVTAAATRLVGTVITNLMYHIVCCTSAGRCFFINLMRSSTASGFAT